MIKEEMIINDMKIWLKYFRQYIENKKVLDIGCGTGIGADFLGKECNARYYLLDYEDLRVKKAKKLPFTLGSIEKMPFKNREFDVAQTFFMLHHLDKKLSIEKALSETLRICQKLIIIEEVRTAKTDIKKALTIDKKANAILHPGSKFRFTKYYSNDEIKILLKKLGCKIISKKLYAGKSEYGGLDIYLYVVSKK